MFRLGKGSIAALRGVHPDLIAVTRLALTYSRVDFSVVEGVRSWEQQEEYVADGVSTTMNSRHLTGHAVDIYPWVRGATNHGAEYYGHIEQAMRLAALIVGVAVDWGGDWEAFVDKPHWELSWSEYP